MGTELCGQNLFYGGMYIVSTKQGYARISRKNSVTHIFYCAYKERLSLSLNTIFLRTWTAVIFELKWVCLESKAYQRLSKIAKIDAKKWKNHTNFPQCVVCPICEKRPSTELQGEKLQTKSLIFICLYLPDRAIAQLMNIRKSNF